MADALLHALAEAFDDLDRPLQIRMRHAPHDAAQRLLDTFGALVVIDLSAPPCAERCNHKECRMSAAAVFEPNWISYRHSLVQVDKRRDADDETLEICQYCECEVDVTPAPHKPGCRGIGAPRASSATSVSAPIERKLPAAKPPVRPAPYVEPEGLDLLEAMDAGAPLTSGPDEDEIELDEEAAAERLGPNGDASSSSPELEEEEAAAVGDLAVSSTAETPSAGELERAAATSTNPYGLKKFGRGYIWTKDAALRAVRDFASTNGHPPAIKHARDLPAGTLPSTKSANELFGSWADLIEQAGFARPTKGTKYSKPPATATPPAPPETAGWIKVPGTGLAYRNPMEAYVAADEIEADGERVAHACRDDGNEERADLAVDQARELAEKIRAAARAADKSGTADAANETSAPARPARADGKAPGQTGNADADVAPITREAPPGEVRLLVSPSEMDGLQRALAVAAIAGARAFADTLEQELAA